MRAHPSRYQQPPSRGVELGQVNPTRSSASRCLHYCTVVAVVMAAADRQDPECGTPSLLQLRSSGNLTHSLPQYSLQRIAEVSPSVAVVLSRERSDSPVQLPGVPLPVPAGRLVANSLVQFTTVLLATERTVSVETAVSTTVTIVPSLKQYNPAWCHWCERVESESVVFFPRCLRGLATPG